MRKKKFYEQASVDSSTPVRAITLQPVSLVAQISRLTSVRLSLVVIILVLFVFFLLCIRILAHHREAKAYRQHAVEDRLIRGLKVE